MSFEKIMLMRSQSDLLLTLILWGEEKVADDLDEFRRALR
jgi:hypothetical protein